MRRLFCIFLLLFLISGFSSQISTFPSVAFAQDISQTETDLNPSPNTLEQPPKTFEPSPNIAYNQTRIVGGGSVTDPTKYPWIAALVDSSEQDISYGQFCGGTLIAPGWVVTAAHCACEDDSVIPVKAETIDVVLGVVNLKATPDTYERIKVEKVIIHPDYDAYWTNNDVALLKLQTPSSQPKINFLASPESEQLPLESTVMATIMGWGWTKPKVRSYPDQLQEVNIPLISNEKCASVFGVGEITENMLCAGFSEGGKDACQGDSGGPLVVPHPDGGYVLTGIVSWGNGCAQPDAYGVYTRISMMRNWILQQIGYPVVLTDSTPTTIYSGSDIIVYGCQGINNLTVQSGAHAKLINFPGNNNITIQADSSLFSVSRSGATVTFQDNVNGTKVVMPATNTTQLIIFDDLTRNLVIKEGKVFLGNQIITCNLVSCNGLVKSRFFKMRHIKTVLIQ
ncbi:MAG: serine protease [Desulfamplus sp.]|nr:serine protease [Desulfamplus sp.]